MPDEPDIYDAILWWRYASAEYCLPRYLKDRLMNSYKGEVDFYKERIDTYGNDMEPDVKVDNEKRVEMAKAALHLVEQIIVVDED